MVYRLLKIVSLPIILLTLVACNTSQSEFSEQRNIPVALQNGDIAFRCGMGFASKAILMTNHRSSYSHVGVVVAIDGRWCVIHEVPYEGKTREDDKIYCEPIGDFFNADKACAGAIRRVKGLDNLSQIAVRKYVMRQNERGVPFDHNYDLSDTTHLYCSELVWRSFQEIGVDVSNGSRSKINTPGFRGVHIMPADIELNGDLEEVYAF